MTSQAKAFGSKLREDFLFDPNYLNLNHGSFGTYPRPVRDVMRSFQEAAEARPDKFIRFDYPKLLEEAREALAPILNASVDDVVMVANATTGVNIVLRNLVYQPRDKILYFSSIYGACGKTIDYLVESTPAQSVCIDLVYPVSDDEVIDAFNETVRREKALGNRVVVAVFDTVVSLPGVRSPYERLIKACKEQGVLSCVDAAHAVGFIDLDLTKSDPDFFVSNCHKWLFVPRGCAVLYVPARNQHLIRSTLPTSHWFQPKASSGLNNPLPPLTGSPFVGLFSFIGSGDFSPYLCLPAAIAYRRDVLGGESAIMDYCNNLARKAGQIVSTALGTEVLDNEEGTLAQCGFTNIRLPLDCKTLVSLADTKAAQQHGGAVAAATNGPLRKYSEPEVRGLVTNWMGRRSVSDYDTFLAFIYVNGAWWVRLSAQVYLDEADFEKAAQILVDIVKRVKAGEFLEVESQ